MTARQLIEYGKKDSLFCTLMFYVVKRSNISAHNTFIRVESRAVATEKDRERGGWGGSFFSTFPALSPAVCDALLLLIQCLCKVHHGSIGIWWQETFCEVVRADITHPIMQSSKQLQFWNKTRNSFSVFLTWAETSHAHSRLDSVSWQLPTCHVL